jgi:hypothetical protein
MADPFPEDVRQFILAHINSVEQLEVLLLLREHPEQAWEPEGLGKALYTSPAAALMRLTDLQTAGLVARTEAGEQNFRYAPTPPERDALVAGLAQAYKERRVSVISLIYSKPQSQVQAFADAFKFRKDT